MAMDRNQDSSTEAQKQLGTPFWTRHYISDQGVATATNTSPRNPALTPVFLSFFLNVNIQTQMYVCPNGETLWQVPVKPLA